MEPAVLDAATLEKLISAAVAAPSMLHAQPWRYRLNPDTVTLEVRAAPERGLRQADPMGRALCVSAGAAVCNLRVAVAHFGWEPVVRLLPHRSQPDLLATVGLAVSPPGGAAPHPNGLYDMIWRRPGSRFPFPGRWLPPTELGVFAEAARGDGATLYPAGPEETARLLQLTAEAERRTAEDHRERAASGGRVRESGPYGIATSTPADTPTGTPARTSTGTPADTPTGTPMAALGPRDTAGRLPPREHRAAPVDGRPPTAVLESRPTIAVLTTAHDRRADWLRAGQALEHVLLLATAHGIRASLLHQALEWSDLRWALSDGRRAPGHVQMLIRLGPGVSGAEAGVSGPEAERPTPAGCHRPRAR
ncbi:Acg family FMN-binding oxidoreductase [Streptomyces sp. NEAU-S77]|uniref:Acg family FMN-binding oxidoreductase n=1 Tax=Streptomyces sp. NEAU-S77 TaxID=3411033 RepID=UPI003BA03807